MWPRLRFPCPAGRSRRLRGATPGLGHRPPPLEPGPRWGSCGAPAPQPAARPPAFFFVRPARWGRTRLHGEGRSVPEAGCGSLPSESEPDDPLKDIFLLLLFIFFSQVNTSSAAMLFPVATPSSSCLPQRSQAARCWSAAAAVHSADRCPGIVSPGFPRFVAWIRSVRRAAGSQRRLFVLGVRHNVPGGILPLLSWRNRNKNDSGKVI